MTRRYEVVRQTSTWPDEPITPPSWVAWLVDRNSVANFLYSCLLGKREQQTGVFYTSRPVVQTGTDQPEAVQP